MLHTKCREHSIIVAVSELRNKLVHSQLLINTQLQKDKLAALSQSYLLHIEI